MQRLCIPGNILLAGEYAITEPGGLGLALAVARYAEMTITESADFGIVGRFGNDETVEIGVDDLSDRRKTLQAGSSLVEKLVRFCIETHHLRTDELQGQIEINTRAFYDDCGRKLGYGSSAATAIAICAGIGICSGLVPDESLELVRTTSVQAHRYAQDGKGSGYDVVASLHGGCGIFTGGQTPSWKPIEFPWLSTIGFANLEATVKTTGAISHYRQWRAEEPEDHDTFFNRSNELVERMAASADFAEFRAHMERYRKLTVALGNSINVPASIPEDDLPEAESAAIAKAVGAGNELVAYLTPDGLKNQTSVYPEEARAEFIDRRGTAWR